MSYPTPTLVMGVWKGAALPQEKIASASLTRGSVWSRLSRRTVFDGLGVGLVGSVTESNQLQGSKYEMLELW